MWVEKFLPTLKNEVRNDNIYIFLSFEQINNLLEHAEISYHREMM